MSNNLLAQMRQLPCNQKGCLSQQKDTVELAWFGNQYDPKRFTCTSCYFNNDDSAIKATLPLHRNVCTIRAFIDKFAEDAKKYQARKDTPEYFPKSLREECKRIAAQNQKLQLQITNTLSNLISCLIKFTQKVSKAVNDIYHHAILSAIIQMNNDGKLQGLMDKLIQIITMLQVVGEDYKFEDTEKKGKQLHRIGGKIRQVTTKVIQVLSSLLQDIKAKNDTIRKI